MTITEFLEARIAEDEAIARGADYREGAAWRHDTKYNCVWDGVGTAAASYVSSNSRTGEHIARHDPARVLAECTAKRSLIEAYDDEPGSMSLLTRLASVYSGHPDYDERWAL